MRRSHELFVRLAVAVLLASGIASQPAHAQKTTDDGFHYRIPRPAYGEGGGPIVCIDEAHHNHHTLTGSYSPFGTLLRDDGYRVRSSEGPFTGGTLSGCDVMVSANPLAEVDVHREGEYPHDSAFTESELDALLAWVRDGGALLLVVDHTPWAGAAADLAALLGIQIFDGQVQETAVFGSLDEEALRRTAEDAGVTPGFLRQRIGEPGELGAHAILEGRHEAERVTSVWTFNGSALYPSRDVEPLLTLGPDADGITALIFNWPVRPEEDGSLILERPGAPPEPVSADDREAVTRLLMPRFTMAGWLHAGARQFGQGRAVVLADGAMCTAQFFGNSAIGMNAPVASQNARFCLNVMHWLSGLLPE